MIKGIYCLKREIESYVKDHFIKGNKSSLQLPLNEMKQFSREDALNLEKMSTLEEVKMAVWSCGVEKSTGFDGFNFMLFREMWEVTGSEPLAFVQQFFESGILPMSLNVTWVTMIPKIKNPLCLKDYRPISLMGSLYKIIAKILSLKLRGVMNQVIDESNLILCRIDKS